MSKPVKEIRIAVALAMCDGHLLLLQRRDTNPLWDRKWEFPGGKIEEGEAPELALERELMEETGLRASSVDFVGTHEHDWDLPERVLRVHLHCFRCAVASKQVRIEERTSYGYVWTEPGEALSYDCLEANADLIRKFLILDNACVNA